MYPRAGAVLSNWDANVNNERTKPISHRPIAGALISSRSLEIDISLHKINRRLILAPLLLEIGAGNAIWKKVTRTIMGRQLYCWMQKSWHPPPHNGHAAFSMLGLKPVSMEI